MCIAANATLSDVHDFGVLVAMPQAAAETAVRKGPLYIKELHAKIAQANSTGDRFNGNIMIK